MSVRNDDSHSTSGASLPLKHPYAGCRRSTSATAVPEYEANQPWPAVVRAVTGRGQCHRRPVLLGQKCTEARPRASVAVAAACVLRIHRLINPSVEDELAEGRQADKRTCLDAVDSSHVEQKDGGGGGGIGRVMNASDPIPVDGDEKNLFASPLKDATSSELKQRERRTANYAAAVNAF